MSGPVANNIFRASGVVAAAAGGLNWNSTILTALTTFTVTVQNVSGNKYFIDGVQQQTLNLLEGFTYKFDQSDSSNSSHPLRFSTTSGGSHGGGSEYTTGVTTSGTPGSSGAYTQIVVASGAPVLYYYCTAHSGMGGTANTVDETVEANKGYWIDTTSTTCTITLPSSPSKGDQIILVDYARTWGTNKITIDSNGLNYQGDPDTFTVEYSTNGEVLNIIYSDATKGWIPQDDDEVADVPVEPPTQRAIFAYGNDASNDLTISNLVNSSGTVASDTSITGSGREYTQGAEYGGDKGIISYTNAADVTNLVSNEGVVASDTTGVGSNRNNPAATKYGLDKAIFGYGYTSSNVSLTNLISNQGVVGSDVTGVGTARRNACGTGFGLTGEAIFGYGYSSTYSNILNKVSSAGVVASDTTASGTGNVARGAAMYGSTGQAIFAFGETSGGRTGISNLCSNTGVVSSDVSAVGTARFYGAMSAYGGDKAIFAFGYTTGVTNVSNKINNVGTVASDTSGVGSARSGLAGLGYSYSA